MWITSGMQSDWACLLANTEKDGGKWFNKSLVIVPMDAKGISKSMISKMGMHASDTAILTFDNVHVPADHIVGQPGAGFMYQMRQFQDERMVAAVGTLVPLTTLIEDSIVTLQASLSHIRGTETEEPRSRTFHHLVLKGELRKAVRYLTDRDAGGVMLPDDTDAKTGHTVSATLQRLHPDARSPPPSLL